MTAAYEAEISALEASKAKKGTSAAQSIQLDQKIADARAGMVKAQKDADSQLEVLATNETGRLAKQERAISSYPRRTPRTSGSSARSPTRPGGSRRPSRTSA